MHSTVAGLSWGVYISIARDIELPLRSAQASKPDPPDLDASPYVPFHSGSQRKCPFGILLRPSCTT